jgi:hypothetical protein
MGGERERCLDNILNRAFKEGLDMLSRHHFFPLLLKHFNNKCLHCQFNGSRFEASLLFKLKSSEMNSILDLTKKIFYMF